MLAFKSFFLVFIFLEDSTPTSYSVKALANKKYLSVAFPNELLIANKDTIGLWDKFLFSVNNDGTISFNLFNNENYGSVGIKENLLTENKIVKFAIITNADGSYSFKSVNNGNYVSSNNFLLTVSSFEIGEWEKFNITKHEDGNYF